MAALRSINVRGMKVDVWDTCFRIVGMSQTFSCGPHVNDQQIKQIIETIYDHVRNEAEQKGRERVRNKINKFLDAALDEGFEPKHRFFGGF
jgi:hypothetical protein